MRNSVDILTALSTGAQIASHLPSLQRWNETCRQLYWNIAQYISNSSAGSVLYARTNFHGTKIWQILKGGHGSVAVAPKYLYDFGPKCCRNLKAGLGLVHLTIWVSFADEAASCVSCEIISCRIKSQTLPVHTYLGSPCSSFKLLLTGYLPPPTQWCKQLTDWHQWCRSIEQCTQKLVLKAHKLLKL